MSRRYDPDFDHWGELPPIWPAVLFLACVAIGVIACAWAVISWALP